MNSSVLLFNSWFSANYDSIRSKMYRYLDEDAFHEAYLVVRRVLLFGKDIDASDFECFFIGCYKRIVLKGLRDEKQYYHPDELFFDLLSSDEPLSEEDLTAPDALAQDVLDFVKKRYSKLDYSLFRLRFFEDCSFKILADYTGAKQSTVYRKVKLMENTVLAISDFKSKYSTITF